ncbi:MAG: zinc ribbon domain-containing protein [Acetobacterium sp.]|nr:zinc ribbon domain-containing protein [Acetobacterium sp.]
MSKMPKYCPRCTFILSIDDTKCNFCGMVITTGIAVDKKIADEFTKEEMMKNGSFSKEFLDGGREMMPVIETKPLQTNDEALTDELIADEIIGDKLFSSETEKGFVIESLSKGLLDQGREMKPAVETRILTTDDELFAEEMIGDEITADGFIAQKNRPFNLPKSMRL